MQETWIRSLGQEDPWRREWLPTAVFSSREFHRPVSLASYSPGGRKESDTTEYLSIHIGPKAMDKGLRWSPLTLLEQGKGPSPCPTHPTQVTQSPLCQNACLTRRYPHSLAQSRSRNPEINEFYFFSLFSRSVLSDSLLSYGLQRARLP